MSQTEPYIDFKNKELVCPWCGKRDALLWPSDLSEVDQAIEEMELFQALHEDCERLAKREEVSI